MVAEPTDKKKVSSLQWQKQNQAEDSSDQSHGSGRATALTVLEGRVVELAEGMGEMQQLCKRAIKCRAQGCLGVSHTKIEIVVHSVTTSLSLKSTLVERVDSPPLLKSTLKL